MSYFRNSFRAYLYILPACLLYGFFVLYAAMQSVSYSLYRWKNINSRVFCGLDNYVALFKDDKFYVTFSHNLIWAFLTVALLIVFLIIAVLLSKSKARLALSAIYFSPVTIPFVVSAVMWGWIYNPVFGVIKVVLEQLRLSQLNQNWLGDPKIASYSLFLIGVWQFFGLAVVIFLSALQSLDQDVYDAARIDGASEIRCFFDITIPMLKRTISLLTVLSIVNAMKAFDVVYLMTAGGPGNSTEVLSTWILKLAFREQKLGYASSVGVILLTIVLGAAIVVSGSGREE